MRKQESIENIKTCWVCKRSEEECLRDFKNLILEDNDESEMFGPIVPQNIKELINDDGILPYPKGSEWVTYNTVHFESGLDTITGERIKFETGHNMFINIYLCDVCQSMFNENWESLKEFMYDRLKEKGIDILA